MAYFADGTPHPYPRSGMAPLSAGWLEEGHPYPIGPVPTEFIRRLIVLTQNPGYLTRGKHYCDLCPHVERGWEWTPDLPSDRPMRELMPPAPPPTVFRFEGEDWTVDGNGEVCVTQPDGTCWTAPRLLIHYVLSHGYLPPAGFLEAVLAGRRHPVTSAPGGFVAAPIPVSMHQEMCGRALAFLINVEDRLPKDVAQMAREDIDANEACLAVQFMRAVLVKQQASLTAEEQRDLQGMLKAMGLGSPDP